MSLLGAAMLMCASELCGLVQSVGLTVEAVRGSVFYPPLGILARSMAPVAKWIGSTTNIGTAFIAIAATKQAVRRPLWPVRQRGIRKGRLR